MLSDRKHVNLKTDKSTSGKAEKKSTVLKFFLSQVNIEKEISNSPNSTEHKISKFEHSQTRLLETRKRSSRKAEKQPTENDVHSQNHTDKNVSTPQAAKVLIGGLNAPRYQTREQVTAHRAVSYTELSSQKVVPSPIQFEKDGFTSRNSTRSLSWQKSV